MIFERIWNYIKLNFSKCENTIENKCKSEEEINRKLRFLLEYLFLIIVLIQINIKILIQPLLKYI